MDTIRPRQATRLEGATVRSSSFERVVMAVSAVFQGFLRISLVSVPVKAFSASAPNSGRISFNQLHEPCRRRIQYKKFCPTHGQVTADEIVSGYEYEKDKYALIDPGEIDKLRSEKDRSIDIGKFVPQDQIDSIYQSGKDYYLLPDGASAQKAYQLIHQAMASAEVCGICQVVISRREELVMVRPSGNLLILDVLKFAEELRQPDDFTRELSEVKASKQEHELTAQLVKALTVKSFNLAEYRDVYEDRLRELVEAKIDGREVAAVPPSEAPMVINLMDAIRKSMKQIKPGDAKQASGRTSRKRSATSTRRRKSG